MEKAEITIAVNENGVYDLKSDADNISTHVILATVLADMLDGYRKDVEGMEVL